MKRTIMASALVLGLTGCDVLVPSTGEHNQPCFDDRTCLKGYYCSGEKRCEELVDIEFSWVAEVEKRRPEGAPGASGASPGKRPALFDRSKPATWDGRYQTHQATLLLRE